MRIAEVYHHYEAPQTDNDGLNNDPSKTPHHFVAYKVYLSKKSIVLSFPRTSNEYCSVAPSVAIAGERN